MPSPNKPHPKAVLLNSMGFHVLSYLESQDGIRDLEMITKDGVQSHDIDLWERKNTPYKLSPDLRAFYSMFNGLYVKWSSAVGENLLPVGEIRLNSMEAFIRIPIDGRFVTSELSHARVVPPDPHTCAAFLLDTFCEYGQIIAVFRPSSVGEDKPEPEVWFQDLSARWHFISHTFKQYMRVMVLHLGIVGWQMAYTAEGLPLSTQQWMRVYCKERLCVDLHNIQNLS
jgi:tubulin polyglutamylase complex subunit 2